VTELHGGLLSLATGQAINGPPIINSTVVTKGPGKLVIVVNAGSDLVGDLTIVGTKVDRETGVETADFTEYITLNGLSTDTTAADANGSNVYGFSNAYITSNWYTGSVSISTTTLTLTDVDVYHVSFEQFNDVPKATVETLDANIYTTNTSAEFDCYLYSLEVETGNVCTITNISSLHVGAVGSTAIANRYYRLRRGNIDKDLVCTTDGIFMEVHYSNSPAYVEDVNIKVWAR
jgi:hypothetical protein